MNKIKEFIITKPEIIIRTATILQMLTGVFCIAFGIFSITKLNTGSVLIGIITSFMGASTVLMTAILLSLMSRYNDK